jgi:hypothetical protein
MEIGVNCRNWREGDSHGFGSTFWRKKVERSIFCTLVIDNQLTSTIKWVVQK